MTACVLLVDDDSDFRGLAARIIAGTADVAIAEAGTVAAAVETALRLRPGAALVDLGLPDGDGITLALELSELPWRLRVVLTSTDPDAVNDEDVRICGAEAFVPKDRLSDVPLGRLLALGSA